MSATGVRPRALALDVLTAVERGARSDRAFDHAINREPLPDADRRLATEIVYGTLRRQGSLDRALAPHCDRPWRRLDPALRVAARMAAYQVLYLRSVPVHAAVDATVGALVRGRHRGAGLVNAVLRAWLRAGGPDGRGDGLASEWDLPQWLAERWTARWGAPAARAWSEAAATPPVAALAVHPRVATQSAVVEALAADGVLAEVSPWAPDGLRVRSGSPLASSAFRQGAVSARSEASQLVTSLLSPGGAWALDACAGRGGKAVQLAERGVGERLLAIDPHRGRLRSCQAAATRHRTPEVLVAVADATQLPSGAFFDRILVDAPCSGLGTLRRHPEIRWRIRPRDLAAAAVTQRAILETAMAALAPGGELLYVTCSTEPEENEDVVRWLLERAPGASLVPCPALDPVAALIGADGMLRTFPAATDLDGFFAARLTRR